MEEETGEEIDRLNCRQSSRDRREGNGEHVMDGIGDRGAR